MYYPFPFVQSDAWLKEAVLFWDHLYRINPEGLIAIRIDDKLTFAPSRFAKTITDEFGFIIDYTLGTEGHHDWEATTSAAGGLVELMKECPQLFKGASEKDDAYFSWEGSPVSKTDGYLHRLLGELGAFLGEPDEWWYSRNARFRELPGRVYMALLAKRISETSGLPVVTDDTKHDQILHNSAMFSDIDHGRRFPRRLVVGADEEKIRSSMGQHSDGFALCRLTFQTIGLKDAAAVPTDKIIQIRKKCDSERRAFVAEVQNIVGELANSTIESEDDCRQFIEEKAKGFQQAKEWLERSLRAMGVQTAYSLLRASCSIPIADVVAEHLTLGTPMSVAITAVAGVASISAVLHKTAFERDRERQANPTAFYLSEIAKASK